MVQQNVQAKTCTHTQASQVILCSHNTDDACTAIYVSTWTKCVILAKRWLAPWWWFPCKPKHIEAAFLILICFNKLYMCISWTVKGLITLMHGITMQIEGVWVPSFEEGVWFEERGTSRRLEEIAQEDLHNLYSSPHVRHAVTRHNDDWYTVYGTVVGNLKRRDLLGNPVAGGRAIIKWR